MFKSGLSTLLFGALFLLLPLALGACTDHAKSKDPLNSPISSSSLAPIFLAETYTDDVAGLSISFPSGLQVVKPPGNVVGFIHPLGTSVKLATEPLAEGITLEQYLDLAMPSLQEDLGGFIEVERQAVDTPPGYRIIGTLEGADGLLTFTILTTVNGGYAITVVGTVSDSTAGLHQPIVDKVLSSLKTFPPTAVLPDNHGDDPASATDMTLGGSNHSSFDGQAGAAYP